MFNTDKSIKKILGHPLSKTKSTTPISSFSAGWNMRSPSFSNMKKKVKEVKNLAKGSVFFPFTQPTVKNPITNKVIK